MNKWILAAYVLAAGMGAALAAGACNSEIEKAKAEWQAIRLEPGSKPSSIAKGVPRHHEQVQSAVDSMRIHLKIAEELCQQGMDHESLLHLDVVRAFERSGRHGRKGFQESFSPNSESSLGHNSGGDAPQGRRGKPSPKVRKLCTNV